MLESAGLYLKHIKNSGRMSMIKDIFIPIFIMILKGSKLVNIGLKFKVIFKKSEKN